ncbi:MAG TPA: DUF4175 family protein [Gemmatimonadaceae bacterium]
MTAVERVARTQRVLGAAAIVQALGWGFAATFATLAALSFASLVIHELDGNASSHLNIALAIGSVVALVFLWRARRFSSRDRVALWIEERVPSLQYSLVTALEHRSSPFAPGLEATVEKADVGRTTLASLQRRVSWAVGAFLVAAALLYVSPSAAFGRAGLFSKLGVGGKSPAGPIGSKLAIVEARVTPPAYTNERAAVLDDPSSIPALVGSRIEITGHGSPDGMSASLTGSSFTFTDAGDGWRVSMTMPAKPAALTLKDRQYERIIVLDPHPDAPPKIALTSPLRDTTLRVAQLVIKLGATATDDIGLRGAYFEYLITTGSGEIFSARTVTTPVVNFDGSRRGSINATLDLGSLKLNQGDVVSIRAIAQDGNTLSGPGLATSDTRTFRIAMASEYDSVAVDAAAPLPIDTTAMSQRMLIMMTEKLVKEMPKITRKELVRRSGEIGDLEDKIRKRVEEVLYQLEGGEEGAEEEPGTPPDPSKTLEGEESDEVQAVQNPDLFEAFNELWSAVRSLQIAEPDSALPHMRIALRALDRARLANRLYLRGMPPKVVVDIARVRMSGKEKGSANVRTPRTPQDSTRLSLQRRFSDAVELIESKPADAIRSFTLMQVEALSLSPQLATALGEAIDAFRKGRDATLPLLRARRALAGDPTAAPGLPAWSGGL